MPVKLQQLMYAVTVAEEGRFTQAAAKLHVSQPSVSSAVAALEQELGTPLFHREPNQVVVTRAGELFLPWATQILADCAAAVASMKEYLGVQRGRLVLGATPSLTTTVLPAVLSAFCSEHPLLEVTVHEAGSHELTARLGQGQMDLALVILPIRNAMVETRQLLTEDLVLAVDRQHPYARRGSIAVTELEQVPLIMFKEGYDLRDSSLAACRSAGFEPTIAIEGLEMDGVLALAAAGVAAAIVPESVVASSGKLRMVRFKGGVLRRSIGIAARNDRPLTPSAEAFSDAVSAALSGGSPN